jgi:4-amino-4-deoxy-L-arabinose transferase-like glycosyltransferase
MNFIKRRLQNILLILVIFLIGFFLRFYNLSNIPNGLYADETAIGYNAYSILTTGKDEYGQSLPLYFRSFDDYKLPVYIYATASSIKIFGLNVFAVRFTSMLAGSLAVVAIYFLILLLSGKKGLAALTGLFLALNPWNMFFSRAGYEVNLATFLMLLGTLFFVMAIKRKNNLPLLLFSVISFLLSVYTYSVTRLISPLIFIVLIIFYYKKITSDSKKTLFTIITTFFIGMLPFVTTFFSLQAQPGFSSQKDALLIGKQVEAKIIETRSYFAGLPGIISKTLFNYWFLVFWIYIKNLVSFFSTNFFFIVGSDHPNQGIGNGFGMFYYFEFPLIILGVYKIIKEKIAYLYPFCLWFIVIFFAGSIIQSVPNGTRTYPIVIPLIVFSAYGAYALIEKIMSNNSFFRKSLLLACMGVVVYSYLFYFISYFVRFPVEYAKDWRSEDQKFVTYLNNIENKYNKVIFDDSAEFFYTDFLFYGKYPPEFYQNNAKYEMRGLVNGLKSVGKYEFRKIDWNSDLSKPGTLFVVGANNVPENKKPLAVFSYPTRPVVIYYDRKIGRFPATDIAYELFESGGRGVK